MKKHGGKYPSTRGSAHGWQQRQVIDIQREDIKLNQVENAWKPVNENDLTDTDKVLREVRSIMNKITPQKFQKLTQDLIALSINKDEERLKGTIDIIFEKAIDEPSFCQTYAQICEILSKTKLQKGDTQVTFRSILLNRCQKEFHTDYYKEINHDQLLKGILFNEKSNCL